LNTKTTDGFGLKQDNEEQFYWEHHLVKKRSVFHLTKDRTFLGINTFGIRMRHEFFDKVLTNKETVDYVIDHLAAANFDPEFYVLRKEIQKQFINQFVGTKNNIT
jgi:hypothetical protein